MANPAQVSGKTKSTKEAVSTSFCQWSVLPNDAFIPSGPKIPTLDAGVYTVHISEMGPMFTRLKVITDDLIPLNDVTTDRVLASMKKFWSSREEYKKRNIVYKRGILLEGPAGSGKTSTVNLLSATLVRMNGIVLMCGRTDAMAAGLEALRRIEPERNIIVIYEDIDELIDSQGEHNLLALLDGEFQTDNIVNIATTNFPDKLGARICNRPSRFDVREHIGMPDEKSRETYLRHILRSEEITEDNIENWVKDTDGFSVAHLKEMAVAVFCLQQPYEEVLGRLKAMQVRPRGIPEFQKGGSPGFAARLVIDEPMFETAGTGFSR